MDTLFKKKKKKPNLFQERHSNTQELGGSWKRESTKSNQQRRVNHRFVLAGTFCLPVCNGDALKGHDGGLLTSTWDFPPSGCFSSVKMIVEAVSLTMPGSPPYPRVFCFHLVTFDCKYPLWKKYQLLRGDQSDLRHLHLTLVPPPQCQYSVKTKQI